MGLHFSISICVGVLSDLFTRLDSNCERMPPFPSLPPLSRPLLGHLIGRWESCLAINDGVMGGVSEGWLRVPKDLNEENGAVFEGCIRKENNGGFSTIRIPMDSSDCRDCSRLIVHVRGDGRSYSLRLFTDARNMMDAPGYEYAFKTRRGEYQEVIAPLASLIPRWRGMQVPAQPLSSVMEVKAFGIITTKNDGLGDFAIEIMGVYACP